jgi:hypothetical protein
MLFIDYSVVKKVQQWLFNLRSLKKSGFAPNTIANFYRCTIESGNCIARNHRALQRVVHSALQDITGGIQTALQDIYST